MSEKNSYQAELLYNRLVKKYRLLRKWARKNEITCFRLYDKDIPEIPLSIDLYEFLPHYIKDKKQALNFFTEQTKKLSENDISTENNLISRQYAIIYLYKRPFQKDEKEELDWLNIMKKSTSLALKINEEHIILKTRIHDKGGSQYGKKNNSNSSIKGIVYEQGQIFHINLTDYLDTGLFFDHRPLRKLIREKAFSKNVLNLFCYTASFSVYAAEGKAQTVESVDMSNTYLSIARENMKLNSFTSIEKYIFTREDVKKFLEFKKSEKKYYDLIILDPPTFSNSKKTENILDINKDWINLVSDCLKILSTRGTLYFSTNSRQIKFDKEQIPNFKDLSIKDITEKTIPQDFSGKKIHSCHEISKIQD